MLTRRVRFLIGAVAGLSMIGACVFYWAAPKPPPITERETASHSDIEPTLASPPVEQLPGFKADGDAGITFRMQFLPAEQGENFKVNLYDHGCGVAVGDSNGDGHDDIYFCNQLGPNALFRNKGDGTFEDVTSQSGPVDLNDRVSVGATFADYDNDGDQDLFVTSTRGGNALFQNDGQGKFLDVTERAGVELFAHSQTGAFFDYDQDGDLDLLVTNSAVWTGERNDEGCYFVGAHGLVALAHSKIEHNKLYRNRGDGTFADVTEQVGLAGRGWAGDTAVFDYDEDGRMDVLVTNMFGESQLYHNQDDGTFADVTKGALPRTSWGAIGAAAFDFNNDGRLDIYIVDMHSDMWVPEDLNPATIEERRKYPFVLGRLFHSVPKEAEQEFADLFHIDYEATQFGNTFFKNQGEGKFEEVSDRAGVETFWPWGIATADFDNDGYQDVFLPSGMGYPYFYWRNYLLMNNGDETFDDQSRSRGIEPRPGGEFQEPIGGRRSARSSRCAATADFDGDGRLDLVVNNFNAAPYYYRNEFPRQHYAKFRLRGTRSNRDAIGATVRLHIGNEILVRQVNPASGYLSHSSKTLHFGLGARQNVDRAEISWPNGGVQVLESPAIDTLHDVAEPDAAS